MKYAYLALSMLIAVTFTASALAKESEPEVMVLSKDNTITLMGEVSGPSVAKVIQAARKMDVALKNNHPIILVLDTPGGSIQAGLELIEALQSLNRPVHTLTIFAASMGFQIAQNLDKRNILNFGTLMSHKAFGGFQGEFGDGVSQLDSRYGFWMRRIKQLDEKTVSRTKGKQTLKSYRASYENELWLNGSEAVDQGYADSVVQARCDASLGGQRTESVNFLGMELKLKFSECPLNTYPEDSDTNINTNKGRMLLDDFLAKGGVLGECPSSNFVETFSSSTYGPQIDRSPLCATDKTLTMDKINQIKEEVTARYTPSGKRNSVKSLR